MRVNRELIEVLADVLDRVVYLVSFVRMQHMDAVGLLIFFSYVNKWMNWLNAKTGENEKTRTIEQNR